MREAKIEIMSKRYDDGRPIWNEDDPGYEPLPVYESEYVERALGGTDDIHETARMMDGYMVTGDELRSRR